MGLLLAKLWSLFGKEGQWIQNKVMIARDCITSLYIIGL